MRRIVRGAILHFLSDPVADGAAAWRYWPDGALIIENGKVVRAQDYAALASGELAGATIDDFAGNLIVPGFVDCHIHSAQVDIIASYGAQLLDWLERYTFPAEMKFGDAAHAAEAAEFFLDELLRNGITTASVFATIHPQSVDAFFAAAQARRMRMLAGKVMMDRNCPEGLRDDVAQGEVEISALIERWHGKGRLGYSLTPRFAPTSSREQLALAAQLYDEYPDLHLQTHLAENRDEVRWVGELFPEAGSYTDVYCRANLMVPRSVFAHCVHMSDADFAAMAAGGGAAAFCPTSNLFVGSGLFDLRRARAAGVKVGIGTDVGGGTSYSILHTLGEAYKVLQLQRVSLAPLEAFHLATLGGAAALGLDRYIGNFETGKEADFVVLDPAATPVLARRTALASGIEDQLFALMILGDDRAVRATYVLGEPAYERD